MYGHRHRPIKMDPHTPHTQARSTQHAHSTQAMHACRSYVHRRMNANDECTTGYQHRVHLRYTATQLHDPAIRQCPQSFILHPCRTTHADVSPRPNDPHRCAASPQMQTCNNHAHTACPCPTPASSVLTHAFRLHSSMFRPIPTCCGHYLSPSSCIRPSFPLWTEPTAPPLPVLCHLHHVWPPPLPLLHMSSPIWRQPGPHAVPSSTLSLVPHPRHSRQPFSRHASVSHRSSSVPRITRALVSPAPSVIWPSSTHHNPSARIHHRHPPRLHAPFPPMLSVCPRRTICSSHPVCLCSSHPVCPCRVLLACSSVDNIRIPRPIAVPSSGVITAPYCPDPRTTICACASRHPSTLHWSEPSSHHCHAAPASPRPHHRPSPTPLSDLATTPADALEARRSPIPRLPSRAKSTPMSHRPAPHSPTRPNVPHAVLTCLGLHLRAQAPSLCPRQCRRILTHTPVPFDADEHAETHSLPVPTSTQVPIFMQHTSPALIHAPRHVLAPI